MTTNRKLTLARERLATLQGLADEGPISDALAEDIHEERELIDYLTDELAAEMSGALEAGESDGGGSGKTGQPPRSG